VTVAIVPRGSVPTVPAKRRAGVRSDGIAGAPGHPGSTGLRKPHPALQHGRVRSLYL